MRVVDVVELVGVFVDVGVGVVTVVAATEGGRFHEEAGAGAAGGRGAVRLAAGVVAAGAAGFGGGAGGAEAGEFFVEGWFGWGLLGEVEAFGAWRRGFDGECMAGHLFWVVMGRCLSPCQRRPYGLVVVGWWCGREHVAINRGFGLLPCPAANIRLHEIRGGKRDAVEWTVITAEVKGGSLVPLHLRAGKASRCVGIIGRSY